MRTAWLTAIEDEEKFVKAIAAAGDIDYTNDKAIRRATEMQVRLDVCRKAQEVRKMAMLEACKSLREMIRPAGELIAKILSVVLANRLETIVAALQPFYADQQSAEEAARRTHCYADGQIAVFRFLGMDSAYVNQPFEEFPGYQERSSLLVAAEAIETVLIEAAKKVPDWMRFLPTRSPFNPTGEPMSAGRVVAPLKFPPRENSAQRVPNDPTDPNDRASDEQIAGQSLGAASGAPVEVPANQEPQA
ncbi:MAG: hypothetical protein HS122_08675 [Opitutaceae bacterium]|nr:hypothetical protein [Opitutaceae bacterium]